jgi:hypothetical protein
LREAVGGDSDGDGISNGGGEGEDMRGRNKKRIFGMYARWIVGIDNKKQKRR